MSKCNLTHQNKEVHELRQFIHSFNFPDPTWEDLPTNFPNIQSEGLSNAEKGMLTGITLAWYLEKGRKNIYERCIKVGFTITFIIITGLYFKYITTTHTFTAVKQVSAATMSATMNKLNFSTDDNMDDFVESTMSAIRKADTRYKTKLHD